MLRHPATYRPNVILARTIIEPFRIRSVEIGSVMFARQADGSERAASNELVRLAFPRRVYTQSHVDYLAEVILYVFGMRGELGGYRIVDEPAALRHFTARLEPVRGG